jgi:hypothetical protein
MSESTTKATPRRFFGKYRGLVVENIDPLQTGRILAQVPDVLGEMPSSWAMPCVPAAGIQAGCFLVPPIGSKVWIEFEQGDPDYPIWTGGFWGTAAEVPALALVPPAIPTGQNTLILSDAPPTPVTGGIVLKSASGAMIVVNETGIYLSNGQGATLTLIGPAVAINLTALTIVGP